MNALSRGQIFRADLGYGPKPWLIVSNNSRNRKLDTVLAVRITTTQKHAHLPTHVPLCSADPLVGAVNVDDLVQLYQDELSEPLGALSPATMLAVNVALKIALAVP
ncbi:MAG: MazF family transcriptional regulator [Acidimicrobiales bacterium]|nr:MAG: MazF family transcriptional regulator [Acidimicrobiales bacterium]